MSNSTYSDYGAASVSGADAINLVSSGADAEAMNKMVKNVLESREKLIGVINPVIGGLASQITVATRFAAMEAYAIAGFIGETATSLERVVSVVGKCAAIIASAPSLEKVTKGAVGYGDALQRISDIMGGIISKQGKFGLNGLNVQAGQQPFQPAAAFSAETEKFETPDSFSHFLTQMGFKTVVNSQSFESKMVSFANVNNLDSNTTKSIHSEVDKLAEKNNIPREKILDAFKIVLDKNSGNVTNALTELSEHAAAAKGSATDLVKFSESKTKLEEMGKESGLLDSVKNPEIAARLKASGVDVDAALKDVNPATALAGAIGAKGKQEELLGGKSAASDFVSMIKASPQYGWGKDEAAAKSEKVMGTLWEKTGKIEKLGENHPVISGLALGAVGIGTSLLGKVIGKYVDKFTGGDSGGSAGFSGDQRVFVTNWPGSLPAVSGGDSGGEGVLGKILKLAGNLFKGGGDSSEDDENNKTSPKKSGNTREKKKNDSGRSAGEKGESEKSGSRKDRKKAEKDKSKRRDKGAGNRKGNKPPKGPKKKNKWLVVGSALKTASESGIIEHEDPGIGDAVLSMLPEGVSNTISDITSSPIGQMGTNNAKDFIQDEGMSKVTKFLSGKILAKVGTKTATKLALGANPVGAVINAATTGWDIGTALNDMMSMGIKTMTGGESNNLGELIYDKIHGKPQPAVQTIKRPAPPAGTQSPEKKQDEKAAPVPGSVINAQKDAEKQAAAKGAAGPAQPDRQGAAPVHGKGHTYNINPTINISGQGLDEKKVSKMIVAALTQAARDATAKERGGLYD